MDYKTNLKKLPTLSVLLCQAQSWNIQYLTWKITSSATSLFKNKSNKKYFDIIIIMNGVLGVYLSLKGDLQLQPNI